MTGVPRVSVFVALIVAALSGLAAHGGEANGQTRQDDDSYTNSDFEWSFTWDPEVWSVNEEYTDRDEGYIRLNHESDPSVRLFFSGGPSTQETLRGCVEYKINSDTVVLDEGSDDSFAYGFLVDDGDFEYLECRWLTSGDSDLFIKFTVEDAGEDYGAYAAPFEDARQVIASVEGTSADGDNVPESNPTDSSNGRQSTGRRITGEDDDSGGSGDSGRRITGDDDSGDSGRRITGDDGDSGRRITGDEPSGESTSGTSDDVGSARADDAEPEDVNPYGDGLEDLLPTEGSVVYFWQPGEPVELTALYRFRGDGTGVRTTYPQGSLSTGQPFGFAWYMNGDTLVMQFSSGYTDTMRLTGYDGDADILFQEGSGQGPNPLFGCRSGQMPELIVNLVC